MADNLSVTAGAGTTIAADDVSGVYYQRIKLTESTADSSTPTGVAANPLQVSLANTGSNATAVAVSVATIPSHAVTNAGTFAVQSTNQANSGVDIGDVTINNANGASAVNIQDGGNSITVDNGGTFAVQAACTLGAETTKVIGTVNLAAAQTLATVSTITNVVHVDDNSGAITVDNGGTFAVQAACTLGAETTKVIGTVNIAAAQTIQLAAGTAGIGKLTANSGVDIGDIDVTSAVITGGAVADDATSPGNPLMIGGKAVETDNTDPTSVSAEDDVAILRTDRNRRLLVNGRHPNGWSAFHNETSAQTDHEVKAAPGAGLSLYITDIIISNGATAGYIMIEEDTTSAKTQLVGYIYLAANSGMCKRFNTPIRCTANKNVGFSSSACTTHSVTIVGYTAP